MEFTYVDAEISSSPRNTSSGARLLLVSSPNKKSGSSAVPKTSGKEGCRPNMGGDGELFNHGTLVLKIKSQLRILMLGFEIFVILRWANEMFVFPLSFICSLFSWSRENLSADELSNVSKFPRGGAVS